MKVLSRYLASLCFAALLSSNATWAQTWPSKPIQMIVPQGAGGSTDALARLLGKALGERLGQTVVIDNRAGAGGVLGLTAAAKAPADGYTILLGSNTTMAANAFLYANFPLDPLKDFVPLALAADAPFFFVVPANSPLKSIRDLVAAAKAAPGKLNYGSGTSSALLCMEFFKVAAGVDLTRVPYKSSAQALTDLIAGQLDVTCEPVSTSQPNVKAGRLRALGQTGPQRSPLVPDIETVAELGVKGMAYTAWVAFYAPAGVPKEISSRLSNELLAILKDPAIAEKVRAIGFAPLPGDPEVLAATHRAEMASVAAAVKAAGIKAE
jgi:tripartite-type tricarboxylate transporter receptor subunit TctC